MKNLKSILFLALFATLFITSCTNDTITEDALAPVPVEDVSKEDWVELTPEHPQYEAIMEYLGMNDDDQVNARGNCGFRGGASMSCGGTCSIIVRPAYSAVISGGFNISADNSETDIACIRCINPDGQDHGSTICK